MFRFFTERNWYLWSWLGSFIILSSLWIQVKIDVKIKSNKINIINGGRYDNLISDLGSNKKIPAVGAAINLND